MNYWYLKYFSALVFIHLSLLVIAAGPKVGINGAACVYENINEAIDASKAGDTIFITPGTYNELLGLIKKSLAFVPSKEAAPGFTGCEQELTTATSSSVIVDGGGSSSDDKGGMVQINNQATVSFKHMWLRKATADFGGIIAVIDGSGLILDNALLTDGIAQQAGGSISLENGSDLQMINDAIIIPGFSNGVGGGIALFDSSMTLSEGRVGVSNSATIHANTDGGGIYANNSVITFNSDLAKVQSNKAGRNGGGMYAVNSIVSMSGGNTSFNTAENSGGGLYLSGTELNIFNGLINSNSSHGISADEGGGGIYLTDGSVVNTRLTEITNNSSSSLGGGIFADENTELSVLINSRVEDNLAAINGGGVSVSGSVTIDNSSVISNSARSGGGIYCHFCSEVKILNGSHINENIAKRGFGGGIYVNVTAVSHVTEINDSELLNNDSLSPLVDEGNGGAIAISAGSLVMTNNLFQGNQALRRGGAIYASTRLSINTDDSLNIQFDNVRFQDNVSTRGGGLFIDKADSILISNSLFEDNFAQYGGALVFFTIEQLEIHDSDFLINRSLVVGGAIQFLNADGLIKNSRFVSNRSNGYGGALDMARSDLNITNSSFKDNQADDKGGAIYAHSISEITKITIDSDIGDAEGQCRVSTLEANEYCSTFRNNQANGEGGAIYIEDNVEFSMNNTAILGNDATAGSFMYVPENSTDSVVNMKNSLIAKNGSLGDLTSTIEVAGDTQITMYSITVAANLGSPLLIPDSSVEVRLFNSILFDNIVGPEVSFNTQFFDRECNNSQTPVINSQTMGANLGDPLFTTTSRGSYRLSAASPSHNTCLAGPSDDLDGLFRDDGTGLYDQGAFELDGLEIDPDIIFLDSFEKD